MSNEELVVAIQAGAVERMGELWQQVEALVKWKAARIMTVLEDFPGRGVEFEDLYQSGYLAMVAAVDTYDPAAGGAFSTWLMYHLKTAFAEITGYRTKASRNEPLNFALSIDAPVGDNENDTLFGDLIPDPKAAAAMLNIEQKLWLEQLHEALEAALSALSEQDAEVLRLRYFRGLTLAEAAEETGIDPSHIRMIDARALAQIRRPENSRHLRQFQRG